MRTERPGLVAVDVAASNDVSSHDPTTAELETRAADAEATNRHTCWRPPDADRDEDVR